MPCPQCRAVLNIPTRLAGKSVRCSRCQCVFEPLRNPWSLIAGIVGAVVGCFLVVAVLLYVLLGWTEGTPVVSQQVNVFFAAALEQESKCHGQTVEVTGIHAGNCTLSGDTLTWNGRVRGPAIPGTVAGGDARDVIQDAIGNSEAAPAIIMHLRSGESRRLASWPANSLLTVRGRFKGIRQDTSAFPGYVVILDYCRILP